MEKLYWRSAESNSPIVILVSKGLDKEEQASLLHDVNVFCKELRPIEEVCYVEHTFNEQLIPLCRRYNLLGIPVRKEYGGRAADSLTYARALARIGMEGTGIRTFFSGHTSIGQVPIQSWGNEEQRKRYLPPSTKGEKILAFGLTEPEAGSNPLEMKMTYHEEAGNYVLNGVKYLISNAGIAHAIVTFAYPKSGGRVSAFIVDTDKEGILKQDLTTKLGMPTANTALFELHDYPVPKENMLGKEGDGFKIAMSTLMSGRLSVAAGCVGVIADCLNEMVRYSKERSQHGKPIAKHQLIQEHIAMVRTELDAAMCLVYKSARAKNAYDADPTNAKVRAHADRLIAEGKFYASNAAWDAADRAVQVFGGRGFSYLFRPGRHLMDVRVCRLYEGTDEIMKLKIASAVLGKEYEAYR
jgi:alkylation response protein AidB-like acyl-CoA dehydrogenase